MLTLPPKFKQALGNGVRTSLYPLVRIYKGVQIDDPLDSATEVINLSIKETNIGGEAYNPLLLNSPSISSKADIINNKYTISSVSLSISNAPYKGKIFSDDIPSLLNSVVQVYYAANGLDSLEDCLLVYTGTIRRYSQSTETLSLTLEDLTEQKLTTKVPATLIEDDGYHREEDIGKPYPMVYGLVDRSPLIYNNKNILEIDKPNKDIVGYWSGSSQINFGNPVLEDETHPLIANEYLKKHTYLSVYESGFVPISESGVTAWGSRQYDNLQVGVNMYTLEEGLDGESSHIKLNPDVFIYEQYDQDSNEGYGEQGMPGRVYRPINKVTFYAKNDNDEQSNQKFIGYQNGTGIMENIIQRIDENNNDNSIAQILYDNFWDGGPEEGDTLNFWETTKINQNIEFEPDTEVTDILDEKWQQFYDSFEAAKFPVSWIQNNNPHSGLHLYSINRHNRNLGAFARLHFVENVGDLPCVTKIFYNISYFTPTNLFKANLDDIASEAYNTQAEPTAFWIERNLVERDATTGNSNFSDFLDGDDPINWETDRNGDNWRTPCDVPNRQHIFYDEQLLDDAYIVRNHVVNGILNDQAPVGFHHIIKGFNQTNSYDSIQWGVPRLDKFSMTNHYLSSCIANLKDIYVLQDVLITELPKKQFHGDLAGRSYNGELAKNANTIMKDILEDELLYNGTIDESSVNIQNDWQFSFSVNEQKEAKQIFENMFKSSLLIPSFNSAGNFKFIGIKQIIDSYSDVIPIKTQDIIKYSFELTKLDDIYNSVNIIYRKNYGSGEYDSRTGYTIADTAYTTLDEYTTTELGYGGNNAYDIGYYGLSSEDAKLEIETDYIRDKYTAQKLQKRLLLWYCNQHLITKIDLPPHYMQLEAGDYIKYDELMGGKLAFGYDYTKAEHRNGQLIYPVFFITKVSKSLSKVSIEAVQVHRGEYGFPDLEADTDPDAEDTGDIINGNGENVTENNQIPDPQDDPNYNNDSINTDEYEPTEDDYLRIQMGSNRNLNTNQVVGFVSTNMEESWEYNIWVRTISSEFEYNGVQYNAGEYEVGDLSGMDLVNHALSMQDNNGYITINKKLEIYPQGTVIEFILEVKNTQFTLEEPFDQLGINIEEGLAGDINNDLAVDVQDIVRALNHILDIIPLTDEEFARGDINEDGILNVQDVVIMINQILGQ